MKKTIVFVIVFCMALLTVSCSGTGGRTTAAPPASSSAAAETSASVQPPESAAASPSAPATASEPVELTIAAAASLTDVSKEIAAAYAKAAPNVKLTFTYGASGALQTQIEQGAPVDVFMSAAQKQMDALEKENLLLSGTRADLLKNKVVLIVPGDSKLDIASFNDLAGNKVEKVAMGDPQSVPAGQYAEKVLTSLEILDAVKAKANYGTDVRQVLTWVESGDVDCGVVYATDAATSDKVKVVCEAPADVAPKITYPVAVLASSKQAEAAKSFLAYLKTPDAAALFEKYGFVMAG